MVRKFDRLNFDTGGDHLQLTSQEQLENIAKILRAYPNVHARVGGYTDTQGDPAANLKLSQDRANVVMAQLVSLGVDSTRLDAKGYGADHPVGDNSTIDGRQANRRIALRVTQKYRGAFLVSTSGQRSRSRLDDSLNRCAWVVASQSRREGLRLSEK